jgi:glycosyltransferase involved in cell wall biosynthesis
MTKICIDARCLIEGRRTGVEEYTLGLLFHLFELDKTNDYVLFFSAWKEPLFDFGLFSRFPNVRIKKIHVPNKLLNLSFWYLGWPKIDRLVGGADVVFYPNIIFGSASRNVRVVTTIHDLSFEKYPNYFSWKRRFWHIFINSKKICRRADKIIAVSDSSAADISFVYGIDKEKITVIPSAISDNFRVLSRNDAKLLEVKEKYHLPFKFILYLGTIEPRKNIKGLIRAYDAMQEFAIEKNNEDLQKYKLVLAGSSGWLGHKIAREIARSRFRDKIILPGFVTDEDKVYFYNLATIFVYPSFFEGFGFPPLEAMKCGVPVITSNNSSLPEICSNSALLIDPDKPAELCEAMRQLISDKILHEKMTQLGLEKSKEFSWEKTAKKTLEVFSE